MRSTLLLTLLLAGSPISSTTSAPSACPIGLFERPAAAASTAPHGLLAVLETHGFNEDLDFTLDLLERCDHLPVPDALD